jgi:hypothetical protein
LGKGHHDVTFRVRTHGAARGPVARIVIKPREGSALASREVWAAGSGDADVWRDLVVSFDVTTPVTTRVEFRVEYLGGVDLWVDRIALPHQHAVEVFDVTPLLTGFNTHAGPFDAHPNARAHGILANALYRHITAPPVSP